MCRSSRRDEVQIGLIGVPWDGGTTNRPGPRHGPRQLRDASTMIRMINQATGLRPFNTARCADLGDCPVNPADLQDSLQRISAFYGKVPREGHRADDRRRRPSGHAAGAARAWSAMGAPVAMIHFDAHTDFYDTYFGGFRFTHGTPFRRAAEEGLIDTSRVVQIGIRGSSYDGEDVEWARAHGVRIVMIEELMDRGPDAVMAEARAIVGDQLCYVSFDIDGIDPSQAPGTGTPEIGGFSTHTAQRMVRKLAGPQPDRRRPGRGQPAVRSVRHDRLGRRQHHVRAAVRAGRRGGPPRWLIVQPCQGLVSRTGQC